jgi:phage N-6-adenine-methyltransferase
MYPIEKSLLDIFEEIAGKSPLENDPFTFEIYSTVDMPFPAPKKLGVITAEGLESLAAAVPKVYHTSNKDDWGTPPDFYYKLCLQLQASGGKIPDVDVCATEDNTKAPLFITPEMDALTTDWDILGPGTVCFMNPPYSRVKEFCAKAVEQAETRNCIVIGLVAARPDTDWWWDWALEAKRIIFLHGRIKFIGAKSGAPFPSAVLVWSPTKYHDLHPPIWWDWKKDKIFTLTK